jgi:hypothetical protein
MIRLGAGLPLVGPLRVFASVPVKERPVARFFYRVWTTFLVFLAFGLVLTVLGAIFGTGVPVETSKTYPVVYVNVEPKKAEVRGKELMGMLAVTLSRMDEKEWQSYCAKYMNTRYPAAIAKAAGMSDKSVSQWIKLDLDDKWMGKKCL